VTLEEKQKDGGIARRVCQRLDGVGMHLGTGAILYQNLNKRKVARLRSILDGDIITRMHICAVKSGIINDRRGIKTPT
jgi:predicted NAD/FAD-binding protein